MAMGLDDTKLPKAAKPEHTPAQATLTTTADDAHRARMMALMNDEVPPFARPTSKQQAAPPATLSSQVLVQHQLDQVESIQLPSTLTSLARLMCRRSSTSCRSRIPPSFSGHIFPLPRMHASKPQRLWRSVPGVSPMWIGTSGTWKKSMVKSCSTKNCSTKSRLPRVSSRMLRSSQTTIHMESRTPWCCNISQAWPGSLIKSIQDHGVAGLVAQQPGKLWNYITGHLKTIQTTINKSYFDDIEYVKIPAFWSHLMDPVQLQHAWPQSVTKRFLQMGGPSARIRSACVRNCSSLSMLPCSSLRTRSPMEVLHVLPS